MRHSGSNKNTTATPFPSCWHVSVRMDLVILAVCEDKNNRVQTLCLVCTLFV